MRRTLVISALSLGLYSAGLAAAGASGAPIIDSYENGCSSHKAGSAEHKKCLGDAYAEISKNCAQLQMMLINNPNGTSSVQQKSEMWCDAKKNFPVKG